MRAAHVRTLGSDFGQMCAQRWNPSMSVFFGRKASEPVQPILPDFREQHDVLRKRYECLNKNLFCYHKAVHLISDRIASFSNV